MEKDRLESLIRSSKEDFEQDAPSEKVWTAIRKDLHSSPTRGYGGLRVAAAVAMVIGLGALLFVLLDRQGEDPPVVADHPEVATQTEWQKEFDEIDHYYSVQVNRQIDRLSSYEVDEAMLKEMDFLTTEFESLKVEMGEGMDDEKVVSALIENYRLRLGLLEDLLQAVEEQKENTETNSNTNGYES